MSEKNLNFDSLIDRRGTSCIKYDSAEQFGVPDGLMGFWVADMDFKSPSCAQEVLHEVVNHGVFGYTDEGDAYFNAVADWMKARHNYEVTREQLVKTPGVVFALAHCVRAFTEPGAPVLIQQPVYPPFEGVIRANGRELVSSDLVQDASGVYHIDFDDFERKLIEKRPRLFILCSPHNPVGRVWTRDELTRLGDLCLKYGVTIVADEIHHDIVFAREHTVFATLRPEFAENCITCTAPSKTFNIAGLQASNIFIPNKKLRDAFRAEVEASGVDGLNQLGQAATRAVYERGGEWYEAMLKYIAGNIELAVDFINNEIPNVSTVKSEGTYLLWVDFRKTGWDEKTVERVLQRDAGVWLNNGSQFGAPGLGFQRMNLGCSRGYLQRGLKQMRDAVRAALR